MLLRLSFQGGHLRSEAARPSISIPWLPQAAQQKSHACNVRFLLTTAGVRLFGGHLRSVARDLTAIPRASSSRMRAKGGVVTFRPLSPAYSSTRGSTWSPSPQPPREPGGALDDAALPADELVQRLGTRVVRGGVT
jgi:hypothetical protein